MRALLYAALLASVALGAAAECAQAPLNVLPPGVLWCLPLPCTSCDSIQIFITLTRTGS